MNRLRGKREKELVVGGERVENMESADSSQFPWQR